MARFIGKFLIVIVLLVLIQNAPVKESFAAERIIKSPAEVQTTYEIKSRKVDERVIILADYFASHKSPLEFYAQDFIDAADIYAVDWKLVPAIAGVESTFGKFIPGGHHPNTISYNAWGWGVYGDQSLGFKSWRDGIFTVTGGLRKNYIDKGYTEPYAMNKIYAASPTWGSKVTFFIGKIAEFAENHYLAKVETYENTKTNPLEKTAATSGIMVIN